MYIYILHIYLYIYIYIYIRKLNKFPLNRKIEKLEGNFPAFRNFFEQSIYLMNTFSLKLVKVKIF
jgi:hypothetical protein